MTCKQCATTRAHQGAWIHYAAGCDGCTARAVARSAAALAVFGRQSVDEEAEDELRAMLEKLLPRIEYETARKAVRFWWTVDHPVEARAAA